MIETEINGIKYLKDTKGYLHLKGRYTLFKLNKNREVYPIISPIDGSNLILMDNGYFKSDINDFFYLLNNDKVLTICDKNKNKLDIISNNLFINEKTNEKYKFNDETNEFIQLG